MKIQGRSNGTEIAIGAGIGAGGSMLATLVLTAMAANLMNRETVGEQSLDALTAGILVLSGAVGALIAWGVTGHHRLPVCTLSGAVYYLVLLGVNALLFDGAYHAVAVTAVAILGGCGAVALLGLKEGRKRYHGRSRKSTNWKVVQN